MNKKNFSELMDSLSEGREILRGARSASRTWTVKDGLRIQSKEDIQSVRHEFGVSQIAFAKFMGVSVNTLQNWEQGRRQPTGAARVLLTIAHRQPSLFRETLEENCPELVHWEPYVEQKMKKIPTLFKRLFDEQHHKTIVNEVTPGLEQGLEHDVLVRHGAEVIRDCPRTFEELRGYLREHEIEGIVFWKDGEPKCKIKRSDFGFQWPPCRERWRHNPTTGKVKLDSADKSDTVSFAKGAVSKALGENRAGTGAPRRVQQ